MDHLHQADLSTLSKQLSNKEFSSVELTQHFLNRIEQLDSTLNAFITPTPEQALAQACQADKLIQKGDTQTLTGIPLAHKDIFCTQGIKTSCGSRMLDTFIPPYESTVTQLCQQAGLVTLGKTNMDEFAMGSSTETSFYGPTANPWDHTHVPGGSSGGSAAAVAARLCPIATGTDTGGSVRQPASFCGITGLKPTYGRVSRWGMIAFASSLDQAGILAQNAKDAALLLEVIAGHDPKDSTCANTPTLHYADSIDNITSRYTVGIPTAFFDNQDPTLSTHIQAAIKVLENTGIKFIEVDIPHLPLSVPAYYVIAPAECSSNLSRYDGVRFGHRCQQPSSLSDLYKRTRQEGFGTEVKRRIMIGTYALSAGYYDAYYLKAQRVRRLIKQDFVAALEKVDALLGPSTPTTAFQLKEKNKNPLAMYSSDLYTIAANLAGLPALSIPMGFDQGLPLGLQLIGNYFEEAKILNIAHRYQQQTNWHQQTPDIYS